VALRADAAGRASGAPPTVGQGLPISYRAITRVERSHSLMRHSGAANSTLTLHHEGGARPCVRS
jgi:hypothetical protein